MLRGRWEIGLNKFKIGVSVRSLNFKHSNLTHLSPESRNNDDTK